MPIDLASSRQSIAQAITDAVAGHTPAVTVYPEPPTRPSFPAVILTEADADFVTPDPDKFGGWLIHWQALIACRPSPSNTVMTAEADALTTQLLEALFPYFPEIGTYATANLAGQEYLIATITLTDHH